MKKVAVYAMSRSYGYHKIVPSLNSLIANGGIDEVYILTEDDNIGIKLPGFIRVVNVSRQEFFPRGGPNYYCGWTYMSLMQAALPKIFPMFDKVLSLCVDTIITHNLSELWEINLDDYYLAGVPEPYKTEKYGYTYVNCGVVLMNLTKLRDGKCDEIIDSLNTRKYDFVNQDCINLLCHDQIYKLPAKYNATWWTGMPDEIWIRHFAAEGDKWYDKDPLVFQYRR